MTAFVFYFLLQDITLVSTLAISPVTLGDSGVYTCQSGVDSGAVANVTVIVTSGKQNCDTIQKKSDQTFFREVFLEFYLIKKLQYCDSKVFY